MVLVIVGDEEEIQEIPAPYSPVFPLIVAFVIVGDEELSQKIPPPANDAVFPIILTSLMVGEPTLQ